MSLQLKDLRSALGRKLPLERGPKCADVDKVAVRGWFRLQLHALQLKNSYQLQRKVRPDSFRISANEFSRDVRRSNTYLRYETGDRFPQRHISDHVETIVPGSQSALYCPLYRVLKEAMGYSAWKSHVLPLLRPELQGTWARISKCPTPDRFYEWHRHAERCDLLGRLCMLSGFFLLAIQLNARDIAQLSFRAIVVALVEFQDSMKLGLFPTELYELLQRRLFLRHFGDSFFSGYHFCLARAAAHTISIWRPLVAIRHEQQFGILFPGSLWSEIPRELQPGVHECRLTYTKEVLHVEHCAWQEINMWPGTSGANPPKVLSTRRSKEHRDVVMPFRSFYPMPTRKRASLRGRPKGADIDSLFDGDRAFFDTPTIYFNEQSPSSKRAAP